MNLEEKIIWKGTIDDNFLDDKILIVIDKNFTKREFTISDFDVIDVLEVKWLTETSYRIYKENPPISFSQIYLITIRDKGKENVINAIRELEKLTFVKSAEPDYLESLDLFTSK